MCTVWHTLFTASTYSFKFKYSFFLSHHPCCKQYYTTQINCTKKSPEMFTQNAQKRPTWGTDLLPIYTTIVLLFFQVYIILPEKTKILNHPEDDYLLGSDIIIRWSFLFPTQSCSTRHINLVMARYGMNCTLPPPPPRPCPRNITRKYNRSLHLWDPW